MTDRHESVRGFYQTRVHRNDPQYNKYLSDDRFSRVQEAVAELGTGQRILDLGCGSGWLSSLCAPGNEVWGLDFIETSVQRAAWRGIRPVLADLSDDLPFRDATFDVVVCSEVLEHLFSPEQVLDECHRLLRTRGVLICTIPNLYSLENRWAVSRGICS